MKHVLRFTILILFLFPFNSHSQFARWYKIATLHGTDQRNSLFGKPTIDKYKNVYFRFRHYDSVDVDGIIFGSTGLTNYVIVKYDSNGVFQKSITISMDHDIHFYYSPDIRFDKDNNILLNGYAAATKLYINGKKIQDNGNKILITLMKIDTGMNYIWHSVVTANSLYVTGEDDGYIYVTGNERMFKVDPSSGKTIWQKNYQGVIMREVIRNSYGFYMIGDFTDGSGAVKYDTLYIDSITSGRILTRDSTQSDMVVTFCDTSGTPVWMKKIPMPGEQIKMDSRGIEVAHFDRNGNLQFCGWYWDSLIVKNDTFIGSHNQVNLFYLCIDTSCNIIWSKANTSINNFGITEDIKESYYDSLPDRWKMIGLSYNLGYDTMQGITSQQAPFYEISFLKNGKLEGISNYLKDWYYLYAHLGGVKLYKTMSAINIKGGLGIYFDSTQIGVDKSLFIVYDDSTGGNYHHIKNSGIEKFNNSNYALFIYPNPTNSNFTIQYSSQRKEEFTVYNFLGEIILKDYWLPSQTQYNVDVSRYSKGIYIVKIGNDFKKIIVE